MLTSYIPRSLISETASVNLSHAVVTAVKMFPVFWVATMSALVSGYLGFAGIAGCRFLQNVGNHLAHGVTIQKTTSDGLINLHARLISLKLLDLQCSIFVRADSTACEAQMELLLNLRKTRLCTKIVDFSKYLPIILCKYIYIYIYIYIYDILNG
jgi:hypothetical protein